MGNSKLNASVSAYAAPKPSTRDINIIGNTEETKIQEKKHRGRPKTKEPCKKINLDVPIRLIEQYAECKNVIGKNQTEYIVGLIEKDMRNNYEAYKQIQALKEKTVL